MSDASSFHLRLPWDVLVPICKAADLATLAALGRVSYDLFTVAAPLLYDHVEVRSLEQMEELFCERDEEMMASNSRINALLSLNQIKTLAVDLTSERGHSLNLSPSRLAASRPIPLQSLQLVYLYATDTYVVHMLRKTLLPLLNPKLWTVDCRDRGSQDPWRGIPAVPSTWTRIEELGMTGVILFSLEVSGPAGFLLGGLPLPRLDHRRVVRLHIETLVDENATPTEIVRLLLSSLYFSPGAKMQDGTMVLLVGSEHAKRQLEENIASDTQLVPWRRVLAVEIEA